MKKIKRAHSKFFHKSVGLYAAVLSVSLISSAMADSPAGSPPASAPDISMLKSGDYRAIHDLTLSQANPGYFGGTCYRHLEVDSVRGTVTAQFMEKTPGECYDEVEGEVVNFVCTTADSLRQDYKQFEDGAPTYCVAQSLFEDPSANYGYVAELLEPLSDGNFIVKTIPLVFDYGACFSIVVSSCTVGNTSWNSEFMPYSSK